MFEAFAKGIERVLYRLQRVVAVKRPNFDVQKIRAEGYVSQYGQDKWVIEAMFPKGYKGIFVDIGAHDGHSFSNTFVLETKGWSGIAVEPNPEVYAKLKENRRCITVNACIAANAGTALFRAIRGDAQMLSGLVAKYDPRHLTRIEREIGASGGTFTDIEVPCLTFVDLMQEHGVTSIDYLSIDVEGGELDILQGIDFDRIHVSVIGVENNYRDFRIFKLLLQHGFQLHSRVGGDEFYCNRTFDKCGTR